MVLGKPLRKGGPILTTGGKAVLPVPTTFIANLRLSLAVSCLFVIVLAAGRLRSRDTLARRMNLQQPRLNDVLVQLADVVCDHCRLKVALKS